MPPTETQTAKFVALANVIIKRDAPREYHFSQEWEYTIEPPTNTPTHLEVWRRNDPNRTRKPYKITLLPQVSEWVKEAIEPFLNRENN